MYRAWATLTSSNYFIWFFVTFKTTSHWFSLTKHHNRKTIENNSPNNVRDIWNAAPTVCIRRCKGTFSGAQSIAIMLTHYRGTSARNHTNGKWKLWIVILKLCVRGDITSKRETTLKPRPIWFNPRGMIACISLASGRLEVAILTRVLLVISTIPNRRKCALDFCYAL